jgi:hypothetical protein
MTQVIPPGTLYSIHPFDQYTPEQNNLWKQLFLILDQIYVRTGGAADETDDARLIYALRAQVAAVLEQITEDPLTCDIDSFTCDNGDFDCSMDKA